MLLLYLQYLIMDVYRTFILVPGTCCALSHAEKERDRLNLSLNVVLLPSPMKLPARICTLASKEERGIFESMEGSYSVHGTVRDT